MFWIFVIGIVVTIVLVINCSAKKREERLSGAPKGVRERFESREKFRSEQDIIKREAQERKNAIENDAKLSAAARESIEVAQAEGRSYVRVWVLPSSVDAVKRWAVRNHLRAISVKSGKDGDVQLSISGINKDQILE